MALHLNNFELGNEYIPISQILSGEYQGIANIRGWVHHKRVLGSLIFLLIRDERNIIQAKFSKNNFDNKEFESVVNLPVESVVAISGNIENDLRAPGGYEISVNSINILICANRGYPIIRKHHEPDFLLNNRHLWLRNEKMQDIMVIRSNILRIARQWLEHEGFLEVQMPTLVGSACEGGSTLFEVDYFEQKAFLTQSWQLYAEATIASLGKIYTLAPSFRAEKHRTTRHLSEFWHLEVEKPWCDLNDLITVEEQLLSHICINIAKETPKRLKNLGRNPEKLSSIDIPLNRITYDKALYILHEEGLYVEWGNDLGWEEEKILTKKFETPFFVTHYPKSTKAFYHKLDSSNPEITLSVDMLAPEGYGEITGGGQRIHDYNELCQRMKEEELKAQKEKSIFISEEYNWYVDLRKFGSVPHSGFGLGIERLVAWICKLNHIRDAILFPRFRGRRLYP